MTILKFMKSILITGNMGYVGSYAVHHLRRAYPHATIAGLDTGFFAACLLDGNVVPERVLDRQYYSDVREISDEMLRGVDAVVHLAAISNDPMGNAYEAVTQQINERATLRFAEQAHHAGVKSFVFASSCSVYGLAEEGARHEQSPINPLTAYARSKVNAETGLQNLAGDNFRVTCLRFATACGYSPRLRLDLVLNDFVACAVVNGMIDILSDGSPWRPLIDIQDMARAIEWAVSRPADCGGAFLLVNAGSNSSNYQVKDLAAAVAQEISGTSVRINSDAPPDKRSYKVDFTLFRTLAPDFQPQCSLSTSVQQLKQGLVNVGFRDTDFRKSHFMRLNMLSHLRSVDYLTEELKWREPVRHRVA